MKKIILTVFLLSQFLFHCSNALGGEINLAFWQKFNDEILINNLSKSFENNLDLKIANSKIKESEKIVKLSLADELPAVSFDGLMGRTFSSSDLRRGNNNFMINSYHQTRFLLPINVSYEIDIWGKNRLKTKSTKQALKIIEQDKRTTSILLETSLAADYFNLIKVDKLLELNLELYKLTNNLLTLTINKKNAGLSTNDDVLAIKDTLINIEKTKHELELKKEVLENQISYLLGDKTFSKVQRKSFDELNISNSVPNYLDSSVILNRPDVISATENILKADYDARIAKKEILPSFNIVGTFGFNGYTNLAKIFSSGTGLAELFIAPSLDILDGGRKYNLLKLRQIELDRIKVEYEKAVLASIQEVNDALALLKKEDKNYKLALETLNIQKEKEKLKLANKNFGLASEIDYILYQTASILAQEKYVSDKIDCVISSINLYKAVGGVDYSENL